jgi:hypothetical protein
MRRVISNRVKTLITAILVITTILLPNNYESDGITDKLMYVRGLDKINESYNRSSNNGTDYKRSSSNGTDYKRSSNNGNLAPFVPPPPAAVAHTDYICADQC